MSIFNKETFLDWRGYLVATGSVALATWLKYLAQPDIIPANVPILYLLAIVPIAMFFGLGPSIFVSILSLLAFDYFFVPPLYLLTLSDFSNAPIEGIFLVVAVIFSYLGADLRQKKQDALREIVSRKKAEAELTKYKENLEELVKQRTSELEKTNALLNKDIVERTKAEKALRESEQRWATTLTSIGDGVIATDAKGLVTFMNPIAESLTGWKFVEAFTKPITEVFNIINEKTRQIVDSPVDKVLQQGVICGLANHTILVKKDGTEVPIDDSGAPIMDSNGVTWGVVLVFRDITERKKAEEVLFRTEKRNRLLADILDKASVAFGIGLPDGSLGIVNKAFCELTGYTVQELETMDWANVLTPPEYRQMEAEKLAELEKTGQPVRYQKEYIRKDGSRVPIELLVHLVKNSEGQVQYYFSFLTDITERKKAEEAQKRYAAELESAYKELEAFSYSVSHDLRAPLRTLDGFSQAVIEDYGDKLDDRGRDYLNRVRAASQQMSELIDDMLKLSRVSRSEMHFDRVNLSSMALSIADQLHNIEPERQVEFVISPEIIARGDNGLLRNMLHNLMENAWKFTCKSSQGRIEFGVIQKDGQKVYFVKDNGAGFNMKYADKLFQPFQRLHSANEYPGTGIGLATIQRIVSRHGGKVWAEGETDKGATFYFTLE